MKKLTTENQLQMNYIEKLFDEKLLVVEEKLKNIDLKITNLIVVVNGNTETSIASRVARHEKWISEMTGKITIISIIVGSVVTLFITFVKNILSKVR